MKDGNPRIDQSEHDYSMIDQSEREYSIIDQSERGYSMTDQSEREYSLTDQSEHEYSMTDQPERGLVNKWLIQNHRIRTGPVQCDPREVNQDVWPGLPAGFCLWHQLNYI